MDDVMERPGKAMGIALLHALRPALPAVIGAAALTFLFAAVMPLSWVSGISWNLYLDRLSDYFMPPVGNAGRLGLALAMAFIASSLAGLAALVIAKPDATGFTALRRRLRHLPDDEAEEIRPRRRADRHPDDPPRPPIRAGRDLPAEGLGPLGPDVAEEALPLDLATADTAVDANIEESFAYGIEEDGELVLAEVAPQEETADSDEPWLQPANLDRPAVPESVAPKPADSSLAAMVARFEAGLERRKQGLATPLSESAGPQDGEPGIDFALEAALSTLQRMTGKAIG